MSNIITTKSEIPSRESRIKTNDSIELEKAPLSSNERMIWQQSRETIRKGWRTFVEVGQALKIVRDSRLYREEFTTFHHFCIQTLNWSKSQANRQIEASDVVIEMKNRILVGTHEDGTSVELLLPQNEAQARSLAKIKDGLIREKVWTEIVNRKMPEKVSAKMIDQVAIEMGVIEPKPTKKHTPKFSRSIQTLPTVGTESSPISSSFLEKIADLLEDGIEKSEWSRIEDVFELVTDALENALINESAYQSGASIPKTPKRGMHRVNLNLDDGIGYF